MKKKKLSLKELKVTSFVTDLNKQKQDYLIAGTTDPGCNVSTVKACADTVLDTICRDTQDPNDAKCMG